MNSAHPLKQNPLKAKESVREKITPSLLQNVVEVTQLLCCKRKVAIWFIYICKLPSLTSGPHFWCDSYGSALQGPGSPASSLPGLVCLRWWVSHKLLAVHRSYWRKARDSWAVADSPVLLVRMWGNSHQARRSGDCSNEEKVIQQRVVNITFTIFSEFPRIASCLNVAIF